MTPEFETIPVVAKFIKINQLAPTQLANSVPYECIILRWLPHHEAIVYYLDDFPLNTGIHCLLMRRSPCRVTSVAEYVKAYGPISCTVTLRNVLSDLASAARHMEKFRFVHRDIGAHNVLIYVSVWVLCLQSILNTTSSYIAHNFSFLPP